jgi:DNA polymerase-3 subunit gamma/tau
VSRCIRLSFKPISSDVLANHIKNIAEKEKIIISKDAVNLIADHARGSFRDGISLLEQVKHSSNSIDVEDVNTMLGLTSATQLDEIIEALAEGNLQNIHKSLESAYNSGSNEAIIASQLSDKFRDLLINNNNNNNKFDVVTLLNVQNKLLKVPGSPKPRTALELCLFNVALNFKTPLNQTDNSDIKPKAEEVVSEAIKPKLMESVQKLETKTEILAQPNSDSESLMWPKLLALLKQKNNTLYGIARMAKVKEDSDSIHLTFDFAFHHKQINESKNRAIISELLEQINSRPVNLTMEHSRVEKEGTRSQPLSNDSFENVSNIFGAHEVLES